MTGPSAGIESATQRLVASRKPSGRPRTRCVTQTCLYCDQHLAAQHEHDHMPIPKRNGGTSTYCVCVNCHALKDRMRLDDWPAQMLGELMADWPNLRPSTRIFLARMMGVFTDILAERPSR